MEEEEENVRLKGVELAGVSGPDEDVEGFLATVPSNVVFTFDFCLVFKRDFNVLCVHV